MKHGREISLCPSLSLPPSPPPLRRVALKRRTGGKGRVVIELLLEQACRSALWRPNRAVSVTTRLFRVWFILLMRTCCPTICLRAGWVAKTGKGRVKSTVGRPSHMSCHPNPNYLNVLKFKTSIRALFFLLFLNHDIILSSSLTLIAVDISISFGTPF